jgi:cold shock CspA family protein
VNGVTARMKVEKYHPGKLYGFVRNDSGDQVFFHIRAFDWNGFRLYPPPIVGETVEVIYEVSPSSDSAPKAKKVKRLVDPIPLYGTVESFNAESGWGFIRDGVGRNHYLHRSEMTDAKIPLPGMTVTFYEGYRKNRSRACYIKIQGNT